MAKYLACLLKPKVYFFVFSLNIIAFALLYFLFGRYPYPIVFTDSYDTLNDFIHICYYTEEKVSVYGAYNNIYPPVAHLPCLLFNFFFPEIVLKPYQLRLEPGPILFFLLTLCSLFIALIDACRITTTYFRVKKCWIYPIAASWYFSAPFLMLYDRFNLLIFPVICVLFVPRLIKAGRYTLAIVVAALLPGNKPYFLSLFISRPRILLIISIVGFLENLIAILIWNPEGWWRWFENISYWRSIPKSPFSFSTFFADPSAYTNPLQYSKQFLPLINTLGVNSIIASVVSLLPYLLVLVLGTVVTFCLLFAYRIHRNYSSSSDSSRSPADVPSVIAFASVGLSSFALSCSLVGNIYLYGIAGVALLALTLEVYILSTDSKSLIYTMTILKALALLSFYVPFVMPEAMSCHYYSYDGMPAPYFKLLFGIEFDCPVPNLISTSLLGARMYFLLIYLAAISLSSVVSCSRSYRLSRPPRLPANLS